ncbi:iron-sulfur cluster-binding protein [Enterococcus aquimarinus]|uniref:Iron-sulfur cluster-binding protein n=1 Tax=Enterococcus aquimarinus TaxID=328396 RepID=A0A1L8QXQ6_9ENTE|nr:iron-sulfur cluster-binding protein [Enterococcus aquimarinus]
MLDLLSLKEKIIQKSKELGIDKIGFATAEPFDHLKESLMEQKEKGFTSGFEHQNIDERLYPELTFEQPKSIISIALAYPNKFHGEVPRDVKRGQFARASWGEDYHSILQDRLKKLVAYIESEASSEEEKNKWRFSPQVDTGEYVDVAVAQRAGLGFIGLNGLLITKEFGSFVYLGEITTNIQFEPDEPVPNGCGDCTRCITACPTKALLGDGRMNAKLCLSYQTQTKGMMPREFRKKTRNVLYGCDICQLVCPYNQGIDSHFHPEMEPIVDEVFPKLEPILTLSNREFKAQFGRLAGSWRGKKPLQRNALIALANLGGRESLPAIINCLDDPRPVIRGTAVWAITELTKRDPKETIGLFEQLQVKETDPEVLLEITEAFETFKNPRRK